jgi:hypothetical protein
MHDLVVAMMFMGMVLSPCVVAASTGIHLGSDSAIRDAAELEELESRHCYVPGGRS